MRAGPFILLLLISNWLLGQVLLDRPIQTTTSEDTLSQILNVGEPQSADAAITAKVHREQSTVLGTANGVDLISVDLFPVITSYVDGMTVAFKASTQNTDTVRLSLNGLSPALILRSDGLPLDPGDISAGQMMVVTYLNGSFHLLNRRSDKCPHGSVKVNETYCIDVNDDGPVNFYDAVTNCNDRGGRLCKWDEHYYACQKVDLMLQDLNNNWEWIDDTSDHTHTNDQVNRWTCYSQRSAPGVVTTIDHYRCCYTLR